MKMKARIRLILEEEFEYDVETVEHDNLPYQIDNFRGLSRKDQQEVHNRINSREEAVLETRIGAAKHAEELARAMVDGDTKVIDVLVEEVAEVETASAV
jgi:hypothetical protein